MHPACAYLQHPPPLAWRKWFVVWLLLLSSSTAVKHQTPQVLISASSTEMTLIMSSRSILVSRRQAIHVARAHLLSLAHLPRRRSKSGANSPLTLSEGVIASLRAEWRRTKLGSSRRPLGDRERVGARVSNATPSWCFTLDVSADMWPACFGASTMCTHCKKRGRREPPRAAGGETSTPQLSC